MWEMTRFDERLLLNHLELIELQGCDLDLGSQKGAIINKTIIIIYFRVFFILQIKLKA